MHALSDPRLKRTASLLAALAVCGAASAASVEYDFTVPTSTTTFTATPSVSRFNPSLGTLLSVTFGLKDTMMTEIWLSNLSRSSQQTLTGTVQGGFVLQSADQATTYVTGDALTVTQSALFDVNANQATDYASPYGMKYAAVTKTDASYKTASLSNAATLAAFTGTSSIPLSFTATATRTSTLPGNALAYYATNAGANGYVIYNFAPVPEPTSFAALALGAVALVRRRKVAR